MGESNGVGKTGEHPATNVEVKKWGVVPAVVAGLSAVFGTGGIIVFLLTFMGESRAQAVQAAQAIATVQAQRGDVLAAEQAAMKKRLEEVDAGMAQKVERLERKIDDTDRRSAERADKQEAMLREVLREVRKK